MHSFKKYFKEKIRDTGSGRGMELWMGKGTEVKGEGERGGESEMPSACAPAPHSACGAHSVSQATTVSPSVAPGIRPDVAGSHRAELEGLAGGFLSQDFLSEQSTLVRFCFFLSGSMELGTGVPSCPSGWPHLWDFAPR